MGKYLLSLTIFLYSCNTPKKVKNTDNQDRGLEIVILNPTVKENEEVEVKLVNTTSTNYYLLFDKTSVNSEFGMFNASTHPNYLGIAILDKNKKPIDIEIENSQCNVEALSRSNLSYENILKVEAHKAIVFKIPFALSKSINKYCWIGINREAFKGEEMYLQIFSQIPKNDYQKSAVGGELLKKLNENNFKFFNTVLKSNVVRVESAN